jgi:hypothetical protein
MKKKCFCLERGVNGTSLSIKEKKRKFLAYEPLKNQYMIVLAVIIL